MPPPAAEAQVAPSVKTRASFIARRGRLLRRRRI
jgi:hypothetical protein